MTNSTPTSGGKARVTTRDGKLYAATVTLDGPWAHLREADRLSRHLDGYLSHSVGSLTLPARDVQTIRWQQT